MVFGYFAWESIACIESIELDEDDEHVFDFQIPSRLIVFDHVQQSIYITLSAQTPIEDAHFEQVLDKLHSHLSSRAYESVNCPTTLDWSKVSSNMTKETYEACGK